MNYSRRLTLIIASLFVATIVATAQPLTIHRFAGPGASLEFTLPQIKTDPGEDISTMIVTTTLRLRASDRTILTISLPYIRHSYHYSYSSPYYSFTADGRDDGLMNLGLGMVTTTSESFLWEALATVPLVSKENSGLGFAGILSDFDRFEAYLRDVLSIGAYGNLVTAEQSMFIGRVRLGPTIWIPVGERGGETEACLDAGLGAGVRFGSVEIGALTSTRTILTEDKLYGDRTVIHTTVSAQLSLSRIVFQAYYRIPHNDDFKRSLNGSVGIVGIFTW